MSLDGRLREGLVRTSTAIDERDQDQVLGSIVRKTRRRQLVRRLGAAAILLAVGLAALIIVPLVVREGLEGWRGECHDAH